MSRRILPSDLLVAAAGALLLTATSCGSDGDTSASNAAGPDGGGSGGTEGGSSAGSGAGGSGGTQVPDGSVWPETGSSGSGGTGAGGSSGAAGTGGSGGCTSTECVPGAQDELACGACGTGHQSRACSNDCTWGAWSGCAGEASFPFDPNTAAPLCPPYNKPAVFFAPHADDETLFMAGAIREHVLSGRTVVVELLTHGEATGVLGALNNGGTCGWHSGEHSYPLTPQELGEARIREFLQAVGSIGVQGVFVSDFGDGSVTQAEVSSRLQVWIGRGDAGLSLKGLATKAASDHPDHRALWLALLASGFGDVRGYAASAGGTAEGSGTNVGTVALGSFCTAKATASQAYKLWDPPNGRYAIGYHSVASLFDTAATVCEEYVVKP